MKYNYHEITATIDGQTETLFGSYVKGDVLYALDSEKASWKAEGYKNIKRTMRLVDELPDPEVYGNDFCDWVKKNKN
jgi:hypothetical protein